jgi:hypothetical protein
MGTTTKNFVYVEKDTKKLKFKLSTHETNILAFHGKIPVRGKCK